MLGSSCPLALMTHRLTTIQVVAHLNTSVRCSENLLNTHTHLHNVQAMRS